MTLCFPGFFRLQSNKVFVLIQEGVRPMIATWPNSSNDERLCKPVDDTRPVRMQNCN